MDERLETRIATRRPDAATVEVLCEMLLTDQALGWNADTEVFAYHESVIECGLVRGRLSEYRPPDGAWEGRLFTQDVEVRWVRTGDHVQAWVTKEADASRDLDSEVWSSRCVFYLTRRYYLAGEFFKDGGNGVSLFTEGRYPGKEFAYPVSGGKPKDRAYIEVREYFAKKPEQWPGEANEVEDILNAPMLVAHRFTGVGVGRDSHG